MILPLSWLRALSFFMVYSFHEFVLMARCTAAAVAVSDCSLSAQAPLTARLTVSVGNRSRMIPPPTLILTFAGLAPSLTSTILSFRQLRALIFMPHLTRCAHWCSDWSAPLAVDRLEVGN